MNHTEVRNELGSIAAEMRRVLDNKDGWSAAEVETRFDALNKRASELEHTAQESARLKRLEGLESQVIRSAPLALANDKRRDVTATAEYRDAFWKYLYTRDPAEIRVVTLGSTTNVGIPQDMQKSLVERLYAADTLLGRLSRVSVDGDKKLAIGNALPTSAFVNENALISDTNPTFSSQITVDPKKLVTRCIVSVEALADAVGNPDMQGYITKQQAISMRLHLEQAVVRGGLTGAWTKGLADAPHDASTKVQVSGGYSALTGDNLIDCVHNVAPQYRTGNFFWVMSDTALKNIRKLKISASGSAGDREYIWKLNEVGGIKDGLPGTIYGIPYIISQQVNDTVLTGANKCRIVIGNFDYATLFERQGMEVLIDPYSGSANLNVAMYLYGRYDFHVTLPEAFAGIDFSA